MSEQPTTLAIAERVVFDIYGKKWYKPREIARLGLIQSSKGDASTLSGSYNFILELIKSGKLKARNYSHSGTRSYWLISEDEIKRYHKGEK